MKFYGGGVGDVDVRWGLIGEKSGLIGGFAVLVCMLKFRSVLCFFVNSHQQ